MRKRVTVDEIFEPTASSPERQSDEPSKSPEDVSESRSDALSASPIDDKTSRRLDRKTSKRAADKAKERADEKLTVYLPLDTRAQLDIAKARLRTEHGVRATYSEIVAAALQATLDNLDSLLQWLEREPSTTR